MTDWPKIINDIIFMSKELYQGTKKRPYSQASIASEIGASEPTITRIMGGSEPKHSKGEKILEIHKRVKRDLFKKQHKEAKSKCP